MTICGANGGPAKKDPYGLFMNRQPVGHIHNAIFQGFRAGAAMLNGPHGAQGVGVAATEVRSSIFFGNFDPTRDAGPSTNLGYGSPPNDTDMTAWLLNPAWNNVETDPALPHAFDPNALQMAPPTAITANAATPPTD